ncbi:hypothetical protein BDV32DRAFT_119048 [Aspergillus pseudonomiae]|nr:hypothetical protein BDV32DRAFT_119048 [Aspergillus pseudonomiae]
MSHIYSHDDNEIASSIEQRIHAMRSYQAALRSRRASEGARDAEEIHDDEPQALEGSHAVHQQTTEPTFKVPYDMIRDTSEEAPDVVHSLEE